MSRGLRTRRVGRLSASTAAVLTLVGAQVADAHARHAGHARAVAPSLIEGPEVSYNPAQPPTSAQCAAAFPGVADACYGPSDIRSQYDFNPLYAAGDNGAGQTIVIFDSFGSPTIKQDLATFDSDYGIAAPPSFTIYQPEGNVAYNYLNASASAVAKSKDMQTELGWAGETTLDVEWSHAMAPGANIALVETPIAESEGVQGLQNLQNAQKWALDNNIGNTWSNSYAATEQSFHNNAVIEQMNGLYATAAADGVSAFFSSGDSGSQNVDKQSNAYTFPTVNFPSSSPDVVSVGGTQLQNPPPSISSYQPEAVWNDCCGSDGGGYTSVFSETPSQTAAGIPDPSGMRGMPDVSYNAAVVSPVLTFQSYDPTQPPGWSIAGGTSAAAPQWSALDAIANQADGALGFLAPRLYQIGASPSLYAEAFHDITVGNNSWGGVPGFNAGPGWDAATGLGTPDAAGLVKALKSTS